MKHHDIILEKYFAYLIWKMALRGVDYAIISHNDVISLNPSWVKLTEFRLKKLYEIAKKYFKDGAIGTESTSDNLLILGHKEITIENLAKGGFFFMEFDNFIKDSNIDLPFKSTKPKRYQTYNIYRLRFFDDRRSQCLDKYSFKELAK